MYACHNADFRSVATGLDHDGLILNADDLSDDAADGCYLVSDSERVTHLRGLLLLLLLRAVHEEIEHRQHRHEHDNRGEPLHTGTRGRCRRICKNSKHLLILQIKIISYYYNPSMDIFQ